VVSLAEVSAGIEKLRRTGSARRADAIEGWAEELLADFRERVLMFDLPAARATGRLLDTAAAIGRPPGFADLAIAGIAVANGLTVLTRNLRHFAPLGVKAHDPYESLPG
jgi:predicted nucleic acid-binding protein